MRHAIQTARIAPVSRQLVSNLAARYLQLLRTYWRNWYAARIHDAMKLTLIEIDDRILKDIGVHRSQIYSLAITPMADRISHHSWLTTHSQRLVQTANCKEFKKDLDLSEVGAEALRLVQGRSGAELAAALADICPRKSDEQKSRSVGWHPSVQQQSASVRPTRRRFRPTNVPWISEAITICREDLFQ